MIDVAPLRTGIVGLGAIGGSLALALHGHACCVVRAWSRDDRERAGAAQRGIRAAPSLEALVRDSSLVVLAVPLDVIGDLTRTIRVIAPSVAIIHTGSLQRAAALRLDAQTAPHVVGTHPIAGTHATGFDAARADLFLGAAVSIESRLDGPLRDTVRALWASAGATRIEFRDAETHDALMSWISHLPQLVATSLAATLAEHDIAISATGPGARDTTRLAQSSLEVWRPLLEGAPAETRRALRALHRTIATIEQALESGTLAPVEQIWERGRRWRAVGEHA